MQRDKEELRKLAEMGWHSITVWECSLKPKQKEQTLDSIAFTLNHIWLKDRGAYPELEETQLQVAEEE
jgi:DNA mismatch endonuclease (patch repair protein)